MEQLHAERAVRQLRELYRRYGYTQYKMSKFEPYDLYARSKSFLVSEDILTFTDADGRLMALKPDVTLSIVKNAKEGAGLQKVYYSENVYRTSPMTRSFREIMQTGLECVGEIDLVAMGEVLLLAAKSLETISGDYLLDVSHLGFVAGLLDSARVPEDCREELLKRMGEKNVSALGGLCRELGLDPEMTQDLCQMTTSTAPPPGCCLSWRRWSGEIGCPPPSGSWRMYALSSPRSTCGWTSPLSTTWTTTTASSSGAICPDCPAACCPADSTTICCARWGGRTGPSALPCT